uniref:Uncharacterized protein n=1 Tax=Vitis vinifera TaxID=29760 RepID=F6HMV4_VITVI
MREQSTPLSLKIPFVFIFQASIGHIGSAELAAYALVFTVLLRFANGIPVMFHTFYYFHYASCNGPFLSL